MRIVLSIALAAALSGCATIPRTSGTSAPVEVQILGLNDFHGALEPPRSSVAAVDEHGAEIRVPAGGAAHLATAVARLRAGHANTITVAAGDLTSASPFASSQFLDEPAVMAMNMIGLELNAVGNHEFDRGPAELKRLQVGGCIQFTTRKPCQVDPEFSGARYLYLAANVRTADGSTLFPATAIRQFGKGRNAVKIGFIGLTTIETPTLVEPSGVKGLTFLDEADTINALAPRLRADGADAVVVLIHQGVATKVGYNDKSCAGVSGDLLPILARLKPGVDAVISGHTHNAYVCDYAAIDPSKPFLLTSAGKSGMLVTDVRLTIDPARNEVMRRSADNVIVQGEAYTGTSGAVPLVPAFPVYAADPQVQSLVTRYVEAAEPLAQRVVGRLAAPASRERTPTGEIALGSLVADAQMKAVGAQIALMNSYGLRADLVPAVDGSLNYGQLYAVLPFGNVVQVKRMNGAQLKAVLEQQFDSGSNSAERPNMLQVSSGFTFSYDLTRPAGQRIVAMSLNGKPIDDAASYRVAANNFLAAGGDNFTVFTEAPDADGRADDLDAFEALFAGGGPVAVPPPGRIVRVDTP